MTKRIIAILGCLLAFWLQTGLASAADAEMCGGIAGIKCTASTMYCDLGPGKCQTVDAAGTCKKKPEVCPDLFKPVCGCDGKTYANACEAARAGVSINVSGKCKKKAKK